MLELPEHRRQAWLGEATRDDPRLRAQVQRAYRNALCEDDFLASPIRGSVAADEPASERYIGPYRLVRQLGTGGMGTVWLAERADGQFAKRVALKLVKRGMDTEAIVRRFQVERQVLADLEHNWITRLLDGGTTDQGLPYFVMEYVDGRPLLDHCALEGLGVDDRLRLFARVCEAVHFAHAHHVVHRDLKPGNVLVDAAGNPRLLDFGIAKVIEADDARLEMTRTGERYLSPRYASPEQLRGELVGPSSDVYALGVILYELLSGRHPYGWSTTTWRELEQDVLERDPERPSRAVLAAEEAPPLPESRRALSRRLRGELDTIVLTALRKEPERRYASASALAEDILLHLSGLPIRAQPDTPAYRIRKYLRRNRGLVTGTTAFVLLLLVAMAVSIRLYVGSLRATRDALWQSYTGHVSAAAGALDALRVADARDHLESTPEELRAWEWEMLRARLDHSLVTQTAKGAFSVAVDAPRGRVAYASPSEIDVLDERTLERVASVHVTTRSGPRKWKGCVGLDLSPDGRLLASVWGEGDLYVHDVEDGHLVLEGDLDVEHTAVAFDPHTSLLAIGTADGRLSLVDVLNRGVRATCAAHKDSVDALAFDAEGSRLVSGSWDQTVRLWTSELDPLHELTGHTMGVTAVAFDSGGSRVVSSSLDGTARIWDVASGEEQTIVRVGGFVLDATFDPSGESVLAAFPGGLASWDARTLVRRGVWLGHTANPEGIALDPVLGRLWSVDGSSVREWDLATRDVPTFQTCEYTNTIDFDSRPDRFASGGPDGVIRLWSASEPEPVRELRSDGRQVAGLVFGPRGERLYALDDAGGLSTWDPTEGRLLAADPLTPGNSNAGSFGLTLDPSGDRLLCSLLESIEVREANTGRVLLHLEDDGGATLSQAAFDAHGSRIAAGNESGAVLIWDASTGRLLQELAPPPGAYRPLHVAFHPSPEVSARDWLAIGYTSGELRLYDLSDASHLVAHAEGASPISALAFHPDGCRLAAGAEDGSIRLWDVPSGRPVITLAGHSGSVSALQFSPDGTALLSSSWDGTLRLWTTARPKPRR